MGKALHSLEQDVSDRSAWVRSWNVNLALKSMMRAGFRLRPPRLDVGNVVPCGAILLWAADARRVGRICGHPVAGVSAPALSSRDE